MPRLEISIYLLTVVDNFQFWMKYSRVLYNQTSEPLCVFHKQKEYFSQATIVIILLSSDKIIMIFNYEDQTLWPVYITIENLDQKV